MHLVAVAMLLASQEASAQLSMTGRPQRPANRTDQSRPPRPHSSRRTVAPQPPLQPGPAPAAPQSINGPVGMQPAQNSSSNDRLDAPDTPDGSPSAAPGSNTSMQPTQAEAPAAPRAATPEPSPPQPPPPVTRSERKLYHSLNVTSLSCMEQCQSISGRHRQPVKSDLVSPAPGRMQPKHCALSCIASRNPARCSGGDPAAEPSCTVCSS